MTFGDKMLTLMAERGMSLRKLAKVAHYDSSHLSRVSRGHKPPSQELAARLDELLGAGGELAALAPARPGVDHPTLQQPSTAARSPVNVNIGDTPDDWDDMERRRLLLAALGMGAGALGSSAESVRQLLDLVLDSEPRPIEDWGIACADHLHALRTRPPAQVRDGLSIDLPAIQRQLKTATIKEATELNRIVAALGTLQANVVTRLGDHGAAIHWWRTAKTAADLSGDLDVRMMVRCREVGVGLYGQRDLATVLRLIEKAQEIAGDRPSFWLADLAGSKAKALTMVGRHDDARDSLNTFVGWEGGDARPSIIPSLWAADQAHFAESWVYSGKGDEARADEARSQVLDYGPEYQYAANVRLHEALCTVVKGGIDEGTRQAAVLLDGLPAAYHSQMITETGKRVLNAVPIEQRRRPAVGEFREVLATTAPNPHALT
ncbi:helix-turn-helix domain-containing protein [Actinomadura formosensis]|uniref:helix-turn-helix domain-containing protein n=1 Tax=Actinomadura formosensis TaxID=60706 RepID=UPI003D8A7163